MENSSNTIPNSAKGVSRSGALMVVFRGHVILACGDVSRKFEAHSVRKSLVSGLYGGSPDWTSDRFVEAVYRSVAGVP